MAARHLLNVNDEANFGGNQWAQVQRLFPLLLPRKLHVSDQIHTGCDRRRVAVHVSASDDAQLFGLNTIHQTGLRLDSHRMRRALIRCVVAARLRMTLSSSVVCAAQLLTTCRGLSVLPRAHCTRRGSAHTEGRRNGTVQAYLEVIHTQIVMPLLASHSRSPDDVKFFLFRLGMWSVFLPDTPCTLASRVFAGSVLLVLQDDDRRRHRRGRAAPHHGRQRDGVRPDYQHAQALQPLPGGAVCLGCGPRSRCMRHVLRL